MTAFLVFLVVLNVGFLVGAWWGSGWRRREYSLLKDEVSRLRREIHDAQEPLIIPLHDTTTQVG